MELFGQSPHFSDCISHTSFALGYFQLVEHLCTTACAPKKGHLVKKEAFLSRSPIVFYAAQVKEGGHEREKWKLRSQVFLFFLGQRF